jgi:hypothetical protein
MTRKSYVQINGVLYDKSQPLPDGVEAQSRGTPGILPDLPDFVSPIDGKTYSGRAGLRDHCARHDVVPTAELKGLPVGPPQHQPDRAAIREQLVKQYYKG